VSGWDYPRVIVHRCGGALAPENTLAGLRIAARLRCRAVEFDVMLSGDGVPVLIHDETLERTTDGHGRVAATDLAALRRLDAGSRHGAAFRGEPLPTLDEAIAACEQLGLAANIEIKPAAGFEAATGDTVGRLVAARRARPIAPLLSSFCEASLAAAAAAAPDLPRALLVDAIPADWLQRLQRHGALAIHCAARAVDRGLVAAAVAAGYRVACYTVDEPAQAESLFGAGVAAIFTDRPDRFA